MSSKGPHMLVPALLTHTSIPPKVEAAVLASSRVRAGSVTSVGAACVRTPSASQSSAACSSSSRRRAARTTLAPRRAKAWAVASPMPLEAPVITTVASRRLLTTIRPPLHSFRSMRCRLRQTILSRRAVLPNLYPGSPSSPLGDFEGHFCRDLRAPAGEGRIGECETRADQGCGPPFGKNATGGLTDHAPTLGLAPVYALARAGGFATSADTRALGRRHLRRPRVGRHHTVHYVGRQAGVYATAAVLERGPRAERQDVRPPRRRAGGLVLFLGREQRGRRPRGTGCLSSAVLQRSHEPRAAGAHHLLRVQARPPARGNRRVRSRVDGRPEAAPMPAGFSRVLPDRAVLSVLGPRRPALPGTDLA